MKKQFVILILCTCATGISARTTGQIPSDYYASLHNKADSVLKSALSAILNADSVRIFGYGSGEGHTWEAFYMTDRDTTDNSVMDVYSSVLRYFDSEHPAASVSGCDIEHSMPNSWWGGNTGCHTAYCDLHILLPADYSANRSKSNIPPGYVAVPAGFDNGVWRNGKPQSTETVVFPEGVSRVFEPSNEYKGDFARIFFYAATRYEAERWITDKPTVEAYYAMQNDTYLEFQPWLQTLLLEWHRADSVSLREKERQEKVFGLQRNRNPFVDYPELVEYIWGERQGQVFWPDTVPTAILQNVTEQTPPVKRINRGRVVIQHMKRSYSANGKIIGQRQ